MRITRYLLLGLLLSCSSLQAAQLTHGPMVGHTTDRGVSIWVRASETCEYSVRVQPAQGGTELMSKSVELNRESNFCGVARIEGLSPSTTYSYSVFLDGTEQSTQVAQKVTSYPEEGEPGIIRFAFGHSVIGNDAQPIWDAISAKQPMFLLMMGDNIYSNSTQPAKQRSMYLQMRADPRFRSFAAQVPVYAVYDDHDYGANNSDRTQPGKERSLRTFFEIWANPPVQTLEQAGIWTRFVAGQCEFWLLDGRYHRSPNDDPDGPNKTMLGMEQREWFMNTLAMSKAVFKFPVSGSSWHCGGKEAWNHQFLSEYDTILTHVREHRVSGLILLGGDQHECKVSIRPRESWGAYDLHEWMAGRLVNRQRDYEEQPWTRGFGMVTVNTKIDPPTVKLEFFNDKGQAHAGTKILYTGPGALRALWDSPAGAFGKPPRSFDGELRTLTAADIWDAMPKTTGFTIPLTELQWPQNGWKDRRW